MKELGLDLKIHRFLIDLHLKILPNLLLNCKFQVFYTLFKAREYVLYLYEQSKLIKTEWEAREEPLEGNSITGQSTNLQYEA